MFTIFSGCIFLKEVAQMIGVKVVTVRDFEIGRRDCWMFECHSRQATWTFIKLMSHLHINIFA